MKTPPRLLFILACIAAAALPAQAQVTIDYDDAENDPTNYVTTAPNDPTTLSILTGSAVQSGSLTGTGGVIKSGAGTLTLTNPATNYTGATTINGGTLAVADGASVTTNGVHIGEGGNTGTLTVSSTSTATFLTATLFLTVGDNLGGGGGTGTLTVGGGGGNGSVILGSGAKLTVGNTNATGTVNILNGGTISVGGTNGIQKDATGTANFNLSGGTLRVVNTSLTSSLPMTLTGSSFINTNGFNATLTGGLSGTGGFAKSGPGALFLPTANTYQGGTTIASGSVIANDSNALGTGQITLLTGSKLEVGDVSGPVDDVVIANSIVIGVGGGTLTNYGSFSRAIFSGPISINSTLTVTAGSDDPAFVKVTGGITGTGNVTLNSVNTARIIVETGTINNTGTITNNGNSPLPTVISSAIGTNVTGVTQNSATNALVLSAPNLYTGLTTVTAGTLRLTGSVAGMVNVAPAGTLQGTGTIGGNATIGGTLAPGIISGPGQLTFGSALTLNTGSFTSIEIGGLLPTDHDRVFVTGDLAYNGTLTISFITGFAPQVGDSIHIFDIVGVESGAFTNIAFPDPGYAADFNYSTGTLQFTAVVPEPSTVALLAAAGIVILNLRRRARQA